ncbi:hypothetical protein [Streptomyces genisteinicus]|uniref:Uncharacterized protein n=1 Tax=Streptomyces genisteinicus TaxID=2768068 RepID=A0A7H0I2X5_9ACTN|nr:hypothetical protein [Streptomyces genisteinicus]QNP67141.1 hypothetical protein IAG43_32445 [Streptomyces genisteinicus]
MKYTDHPAVGGAAAAVAAAALVLGGAGAASAETSAKPQQITAVQLQTHLAAAVELERMAAACTPACAGQIV